MGELEFFPQPQKDEKQIREITRAFVNAQLRPSAVEDDREKKFRREVFNELASLGLHCLAIPESFGGRGAPYRCYYAAIEEIARGSASMAVTVGVTNLPMGALIEFGTAEQQEKFLPPLVSGEWIGGFALSENQSGSDAAGLICQAKKTDGGYVLNGTKMWSSSAEHADLFLVMARTGEHKTKGVTAFLVPKDTPGFRPGKLEDKLGLNASSTAELVFENCKLPESLRIAPEGHGMKVALSQLDSGRITIGAAGVALAIEALEQGWNHFTEGKAGGAPFPDAIRDNFARLYARTQAGKTLLAAAAVEKDLGGNVTLIASQTKLMGSDLAMDVTSQVVEMMGPAGVVRETGVERLMRDAKALQIVEGTNQIQQLVIGREMDRMWKDS